MDISEIQKILPHRYPFLLIDKIIEFDPDISAHAVKCVTINEPFFEGHFPGRPLMPGVLVIEAPYLKNCGLILAPEINFYLRILNFAYDYKTICV